MESAYWGRAVITSLSLVAVTFGIWVVRSTPGLTWLALLIGLPAFIFEVWSVIDEDNTAVAFLAYFLLAIFYMYVAYGLVAYMFADSWVTKDEMFAVGAAFTVLLFAFAYLYGAIQTPAPGSFVGFAPGEHRSFPGAAVLLGGQPGRCRAVGHRGRRAAGTSCGDPRAARWGPLRRHGHLPSRGHGRDALTQLTRPAGGRRTCVGRLEWGHVRPLPQRRPRHPGLYP
uniref:ABC transporter permease n=1 Tax=Janibacter limosus TaxID=53458 RepID=A0AC61U1D2_9MICO|nr:ABC transporter permease [Janibacter limosus]